MQSSVLSVLSVLSVPSVYSSSAGTGSGAHDANVQRPSSFAWLHRAHSPCPLV